MDISEIVNRIAPKVGGDSGLSSPFVPLPRPPVSHLSICPSTFRSTLCPSAWQARGGGAHPTALDRRQCRHPLHPGHPGSQSQEEVSQVGPRLLLNGKNRNVSLFFFFQMGCFLDSTQNAFIQSSILSRCVLKTVVMMTNILLLLLQYKIQYSK